MPSEPRLHATRSSVALIAPRVGTASSAKLLPQTSGVAYARIAGSLNRRVTAAAEPRTVYPSRCIAWPSSRPITPRDEDGDFAGQSSHAKRRR